MEKAWNMSKNSMKIFLKSIVPKLKIISYEPQKVILFYETLARVNNWFIYRDIKNHTIVENGAYFHPTYEEKTQKELRDIVFREEYKKNGYYEEIFLKYRGIDKTPSVWIESIWEFFCDNRNLFEKFDLYSIAKNKLKKIGIDINKDEDSIINSMVNYITSNYDKNSEFISEYKDKFVSHYKVDRVLDDKIDWQNKLHGPDGRYKKKGTISEFSSIKAEDEFLNKNLSESRNIIEEAKKDFADVDDLKRRYASSRDLDSLEELAKFKEEAKHLMASLRKKYDHVQQVYENFQTTAITWFSKRYEDIKISIEKLVKFLKEKYNEICNFFYEVFHRAKIEEDKKVKVLEQEISQLGFSHVFYKNMSLKVAQTLNDAVKDIFDRYPKLKNQIRCIGEYYPFYLHIKEDWINYLINEKSKTYKEAEKEVSKALRDRKQEFGISSDIDGGPVTIDLRGMYFNSERYKEASGEYFHPQGCNNMKGAIYHEIGHNMDYMLKLSENEDIRKIYDDWVKKLVEELKKDKDDQDENKIKEEKEKLSKEFCGSVLPENNANEKKGYKVDPYKEFVAEALAEYFMFGKSSSELSSKVGNKMEELYAKIA